MYPKTTYSISWGFIGYPKVDEERLLELMRDAEFSCRTEKNFEVQIRNNNTHVKVAKFSHENGWEYTENTKFAKKYGHINSFLPSLNHLELTNCNLGIKELKNYKYVKTIDEEEK